MSSNATHLWQLRLEWPSSVAVFLKLYSWSSSSQQVKNHVLHKNLLSSLISIHDLECLASIFWDQHQKLKLIGLQLSRHGWNSLQTAPLSSSCQGICHHCYNNLLCHWIHQLDTSEPGRCYSMCQKREVQASGLIFSLVVWQSRLQLHTKKNQFTNVPFQKSFQKSQHLRFLYPCQCSQIVFCHWLR